MVPPYVCTGNNGSLYDQFHTNVEGSGQLVENADVFDRLATEYNQHKFALKVTYTGQAAEAMQGAFQPLIESIGQGYDLCRRSAALLTDQGGGFDTTQAKIQKPVNVPPKPWLNSMTPWDTGYDKAVEQNSNIDTANQQAFFKYAITSLSNSVEAPKFESGTAGFGAITVTEGQQVNPGDPNQVLGRHSPAKDQQTRRNSSPEHTPGVPQPTQTQPPVPGHVGDAPSDGIPVQPGHNRPGGTGSQGFLAPQGIGGTGPQVPAAGPGSSGFGPGGGGLGPVGGFVPGVGGSGGQGRGSTPRVPGGGGAGIGPEGGRGAASGPVAAGRAGAGGPGATGAGMAGAGGRKEEDQEHTSASYLVNQDNGDQIVGDLPGTPPSVIG
jgi:hypothetical protein